VTRPTPLRLRLSAEWRRRRLPPFLTPPSEAAKVDEFAKEVQQMFIKPFAKKKFPS
jgi:hypothetical protein